MAITQEELKRRLSYDPLTGAWTWRETRCGRAIKGAPAGFKHRTGYWCIRLDGKWAMLHRLAFLYMTGSIPDVEIDHINRDRSDCRWANLRPATRSQNAANGRLRQNNKTGVTGVCFNKYHGKYQAYVRREGRCVTVGRFDTVALAAQAVATARKESYGEFA